MKFVTTRQLNGAKLALEQADTKEPGLVWELTQLLNLLLARKETGAWLEDKVADAIISVEHDYTQLKRYDRR